MAGLNWANVPSLVLAFLTLLHVTWTKHCFVVAPNMLRLGSTETVAITVEEPPMIVTLSLHEYPSERLIWERTESITNSSSRITQIRLTDRELPQADLLPDAKAYVVLHVTCSNRGTSTSSKARILVSRTSAEYVFIQTDKPIYRPGGDAQIRLLSVDENLKPSRKELVLQILNPQGIVVDEKAFRPERGPIFNHRLIIPDTTITGIWTLVVRYGYKGVMSVNTTFEVQKYVLPKFSVNIFSNQNYILKTPASTSFNFTVRAEFVNQQPVQGFVTYRLGAKNDIGHVHWMASNTKPKELTEGKADFSISTDILRRPFERSGRNFDILFSGHFKLVIEATVMEEATAAREISTYDKTYFTLSPYVISLAKTQKSFKPGINTYVLAEVTHINGAPASGVQVKLESSTAVNGTLNAQTDHRGLASFPISTSIGERAINVQVFTSEPRLQGDQQARASLSIQPYSEPNKPFIGIERSDPKKIYKAGDVYEAVLFTDTPREFKTIYFAVVSKGRVHLLNKLPEGLIIQRGLHFAITENMTPSFRIVAYAETKSGQLLSDSVYVNTEPACTKDSEFTISRKAQRGRHSEPGSTETLVVSGKAGTTVGLLGVDKAVYLLRRKDLLTQDRLFKTLDSRDLGCGFGGGVDTRQALRDAGVVVLSSSFENSVRQDSSCHEQHRRRRREAIEELPEEYDGTLRKCCEHGFKKDRFARTCERRVEVLREYVDDDDINGTACVEAFERCCFIREDVDDEAQERAGDSEAGFDDLDELEDDDTGGAATLWRSDFRETWLFDTITIGPTGTTEFSTTLPSSITTWELTAVSVSPDGGVCIAPPTEILSFTNVFLEVNLPYSVIVNEQVEIPVTVYNYGFQDISANVYLHGTRDICSGAKVGQKTEPQKLRVPAGRGRTAVFPVIPLDVGERIIEISAFTSQGTDAVQKKLRIEPRGLLKTDNVIVQLDPTNQQRRKARSARNLSKAGVQVTDVISGGDNMQVVTIRKPPAGNIIPGTGSCELGIVGDRVGPALDTAINSPHGLVILPTGCGEQTMSKLAPTLYVYGYLKTSQKITDALEDKALDYIRKGYRKMLTYRKRDGSFSVFQNSESKLWLTAFVIRNFCEAQKWTKIDENIIPSGLSYLLKAQEPGGNFLTTTRSAFWYSGGVDGTVPLTAYILITLTECANDGVELGTSAQRARALAYLEGQLERTSDPYTLALLAYALTLTNSSTKDIILGRLRNVANYREGDNRRHIPATNPATTIEATAYAIMALINNNEDLGYINSYINWMNQQLQPSGAFKSTQDTVVALQALTRYSAYAKEKNIDLTCEVTLSGSRDFNETVRIRRDNSHLLQKIPGVGNSDLIFLNVKGTGTANAFFTYSYREEQTEDDLCKFDLDIKFEEAQADAIVGRVARAASLQENTKRRKDRTYNMRVCTRFLGNEDIKTSIIEVGLLTGFVPVRSELDRLEAANVVDLYELSARKVVFYLPRIPREAHVCIPFTLTREFVVGKVQTSTVRVYDYYNPEVACERFYGPDSSSPMLKYFCPEGSSVCQCAEGGCPNDEPFKQFMIISGDNMFPEEVQRENMREFACDKAHYVWKGRVSSVVDKDGFKSIQFLISAVLKPGREGKDELMGRTRLMKIRDKCKTFNLEGSDGNNELIVMGVESELKEEGTQQYQYMIDSSAIVVPAVVKRNPWQRKLMAWFNAEFSKAETPCFH